MIDIVCSLRSHRVFLASDKAFRVGIQIRINQKFYLFNSELSDT